MKFLGGVLKKNIKYFIPLLIFTVACIYFRLKNTGFIGSVTNGVLEAIKENSSEGEIGFALGQATIKLLGICAAISITGALGGFFATKMAANAAKDLRQNLFEKILCFSLPEANRFSISALITRCTVDINQVQGVLYVIFTTVLQVPLLIVGGISSMIANQSGLSWTIVLASVLTVIVITLVAWMIYKIAARYQEKMDQMNLVTREALTGVQIIRAFNRDEWNEERLKKNSKEFRELNLSFSKKLVTIEPSVYFILDLVNVLALYFGAGRVESGLISMGIILSYSGYLYMIVVGIYMLGMSMFNIIRMFISIKRINEVMNIEPSITDGEKDIDSVSDYSVEFKNVSFNYGDDAGNVIRNISFAAPSGKVTAIIGNTGCGKTTLLNLIPRLYDASEGEICIGGVDVRDLKVKEVRDSIGYVSQKAVLFSGNIGSNVEFGSGCEAESVNEAVRIAQMKEFTDSHEEGLQYEIARGGSNVSGGQRQRLSIARAIAKEPKIYLFDDCFSALDYKTDVTIRKEFFEKRKDATVIIVAQRVSSISDADKIIVMHDGEVVGEGTSDELFGKCDYYREIVKSQVSEKEYEGLLRKNG